MRFDSKRNNGFIYYKIAPFYLDVDTCFFKYTDDRAEMFMLWSEGNSWAYFMGLFLDNVSSLHFGARIVSSERTSINETCA